MTTWHWSIRGFWAFYRTEWTSLGELVGIEYFQDHALEMRNRINHSCWHIGPIELDIMTDGGPFIDRIPRLAGYDDAWVRRGL